MRWVTKELNRGDWAVANHMEDLVAIIVAVADGVLKILGAS